jgi:hypothetical protein
MFFRLPVVFFAQFLHQQGVETTLPISNRYFKMCRTGNRACDTPIYCTVQTVYRTTFHVAFYKILCKVQLGFQGFQGLALIIVVYIVEKFIVVKNPFIIMLKCRPKGC